MQTVWASQLVIDHGANDGQEVFSTVVDLMQQWVKILLARYGVIYDVNSPDPLQDPLHQVTVHPVQVDPSLGQGWRVTLTHPDAVVRTDARRYSTLIVRTDVQVRDEAHSTIVTIRQLLLANSAMMNSLHYEVRPPAIVPTLVDAFRNIRCGNVVINERVKRRPAGEMGSFVRFLESTSRDLPLVLISSSHVGSIYLGDPLVNPLQLADQLLGLAKVEVLADNRASNNLKNTLGNTQLSCRNGAVRIYWPGFSRNDEQQDHRLFGPAEIITSNSQYGEPTSMNRLARILANSASTYIGPDTKLLMLERDTMELKYIAQNNETLEEYRRQIKIAETRLEIRPAQAMRAVNLAVKVVDNTNRTLDEMSQVYADMSEINQDLMAKNNALRRENAELRGKPYLRVVQANNPTAS